VRLLIGKALPPKLLRVLHSLAQLRPRPAP
jgi:hypothetical protein